MTGIRPNIDHASCLAGLASVSTDGAIALEQLLERLTAGPSGSGSATQASAREQLVDEADAEADRGARLAGRS